MNTLRVTPRQAFEVARLLNRTGDGIVYGDAEIVTVLVDVYGTGSPNLALELDRDGEVIAKQVLTLHQPAEDPCEDFSDEQELPATVDLSHARPARARECAPPFHDDAHTCSIGGRLLPAGASGAGGGVDGGGEDRGVSRRQRRRVPQPLERFRIR